MPDPAHIFDAKHIQRAVRRRMHRLHVALCGVGLVVVGAVLLSARGTLSAAGGAWVVTGALLVAGIGMAWRHQRLARTVWCVRLSHDAITGYDCARHKTVVPWDAVDRIDVTDDALVVMQSPYRFVAVSTAFFDYPALSHRVLDAAAPHGVPLCLNGQRLDEVDVYALYPFLRDAPSADAAGPPP